MARGSIWFLKNGQFGGIVSCPGGADFPEEKTEGNESIAFLPATGEDLAAWVMEDGIFVFSRICVELMFHAETDMKYRLGAASEVHTLTKGKVTHLSPGDYSK